VWLATISDGGPTGGFFRERHPYPGNRCPDDASLLGRY
jgi:hypothetical protein